MSLVNTAVTGKGLPSSCTPIVPPWSETNLSVLAPLQEPDHSALHKMFTGSKEHTKPWQTRFECCLHRNQHSMTVYKIPVHNVFDLYHFKWNHTPGCLIWHNFLLQKLQTSLPTYRSKVHNVLLNCTYPVPID